MTFFLNIIFLLEFDKFLEERAKAAEHLPTLPSPPTEAPGTVSSSKKKKQEKTEESLFTLWNWTLPPAYHYVWRIVSGKSWAVSLLGIHFLLVNRGWYEIKQKKYTLPKGKFQFEGGSYLKKKIILNAQSSYNGDND